MDINIEAHEAVQGFAALAQETRLEAFRLLVGCDPEGMAAGEIARAVGVPQNTMSSHLAVLLNARLLQSERRGRSIVYSVHKEGTQALLRFLLEDCCQGQPEACVSLIGSVLPGSCNAGASRCE
jgi:DNA-binding transcriptional ArsR family regulator